MASTKFRNMTEILFLGSCKIKNSVTEILAKVLSKSSSEFRYYGYFVPLLYAAKMRFLWTNFFSARENFWALCAEGKKLKCTLAFRI